MTLKTGSTIKLNSGGPIMTVAEVSDGDVFCYWFAGETRHQGSFPIDSVHEVPRPQGGGIGVGSVR